MPRPLIAARPSDVARLVLAGSLGVLVVGGYAAWRIWDQGSRDEQRPVDAIVVLGAAQYDGRPSPVYQARLDHAVALYYAGIAPRIVMTGGKAAGDRWTEAETGRRYAVAHDVPDEAILLEDRGRNTLESLEGVAAILAAERIGPVVFVSDRTHMLRVLRMARDLGIEGYGSPTPSSPLEHDGRRRAEALIHELGALAVYFVTGGAPALESVDR